MRYLSDVTLQLSNYIRDKGINLSKISRDTGISYMALYDSLFNSSRTRDLRDYELLKICRFLGVNPMDFLEKPRAPEQKGA